MNFKEAKAEVNKYLPHFTSNSFVEINGSPVLVRWLVIMPKTDDEILRQRIVFEVIDNAKDNEYVLTELNLLYEDLDIFAAIRMSGNNICVPFDGFKEALQASGKI